MNDKQLADLIIKHKSFELSESILKEPDKYEVEFFTVFNNENLYKVLPKDILISTLIDELITLYDQIVLPELNSIIEFSKWVFNLFNDTPQNNKYKNQRFITSHIIPQFLVNKGFKIQENDLALFQEINSQKKDVLSSISKVIYEITDINKMVLNIYQLCDIYKVNIWESVVNNAKENPLRTSTLIIENLDGFSNSHKNLLRGLLLGININTKDDNFHLMEELFKKVELQWVVINALTPLCNQTEKILKKVLDLVESCDSNDNNFKELAWLYTHIWSENLRNNIGVRCYKNLKILISLDNNIAQKFTLDNLAYFGFPEKAVISILRIFICSPNLTEKFAKNISNSLEDVLIEGIKSPFLFFNFLEELAQKIDFFQEKPLNESIVNYFQKYSDISCSFIISLLSSNKGKSRMLGKYLLDLFINTYPNDYNKKLNGRLIHLPVHFQLRLLLTISVSIDFSIKANIRLIIPLIYSYNHDVIDLILTIIISNVPKDEDILHIINEELENNEETLKLINMLNSFNDNFKQFLEGKSMIKELQPQYTQKKYYDFFTNLYSKEFEKKFSEVRKKDSLLNIMGNEILLLKGGGWRKEGEIEFKQLNHFQSTISIPALIFLNPDKDLVMKNTFFNENWIKTSDWKKWLRNFLLKNI